MWIRVCANVRTCEANLPNAMKWQAFWSSCKSFGKIGIKLKEWWIQLHHGFDHHWCHSSTHPWYSSSHDEPRSSHMIIHKVLGPNNLFALLISLSCNLVLYSINSHRMCYSSRPGAHFIDPNRMFKITRLYRSIFQQQRTTIARWFYSSKRAKSSMKQKKK